MFEIICFTLQICNYYCGRAITIVVERNKILYLFLARSARLYCVSEMNNRKLKIIAMAISNVTRRPPEFKHIIKGRNRK